jgi:transposase, IS30 family
MGKTISFDDGNEFAEHHRLHKTLGVQTFFCDPPDPWQNGGVEDSIGRLATLAAKIKEKLRKEFS